MGLTLIDSSIWIDLIRGVRGPTEQEVTSLLQMHLAAMTRTVFLELIQGSRTTSQVKMVEDLWSLCIPLPITDDMWTSCAHICRDARARGDIFNPLDVLVAVCARDHEARLLHRDEDHERIAKFLT